MPTDPASRASERRIAVVAPMPSELRPLAQRLGLVRAGEGAVFRGNAGRVEIFAAVSGIGMQAGARCAARLLEAHAPDHLVVVGIAGGIGASVSIGDLVVPELALDLDTGERHRPTPLGPYLPRGILASRDALLASPGEAQHLAAQGIVAIDMETAAIARVCSAHGCPWTAFRAISDRADDGTTDAAVFDLAGPDGRPRPAAVLRFALQRPARVPQLFRLARGAARASRAAAQAAATAIRTLATNGERRSYA